jgi:hypothetical protein
MLHNSEALPSLSLVVVAWHDVPEQRHYTSRDMARAAMHAICAQISLNECPKYIKVSSFLTITILV